MSSKRRRSARPDPARFRLVSNLEMLESRQLLAASPYLPVNAYPTVANAISVKSPGSVPIGTVAAATISSTANPTGFTNEGKVITGEDRQGNRYELKLTGPGEIIVTDTSPNDGVLDDDINTITLVGTSATQSVLVGTVQQPYALPNDATLLPTLGVTYFNSLTAQQGVKSIILNGFILTDTITPPGSTSLSPAETELNQTTGINLHGGVGTLDFEGIDGRFPLSFNPVPINVIIGNPSTPLTIKPSIRIDHIYNTSFDDTAFAPDGLPNTTSTGSQTIPTGPLTSPTISLVVNGAIANFDVVSITQQPDASQNYSPINVGTLTNPINPITNPITQSVLTIPAEFIPSDSAALEYQFPTVGTTGRTAVQATAVGNIKASGAVTNTTFSKSAKPSTSSLTGLNSVGSATFGSTTDALDIDARGKIGKLTFKKGLGNPANDTSNPLNLGQPASQNGYAASGNIAAQITTESSIGSLTVGPATLVNQTPVDPADIKNGIGGTNTVSRPGTAVTSSLVSAAGSIGKVKITGDLDSSEIKSGYNYTSAIAGVDGVSGKSSIGPVTLDGNLVNSVLAASYRPNDGVYGSGNNTAGNGTITGTQDGSNYQTTTGQTVLGNVGAGVFARHTSADPAPAPKKTKTTTKK
jgi:hypothetical protein